MNKIHTVVIVNSLNQPADIVAVKSFESFNEAKKCQQEIFDEACHDMYETFKEENVAIYTNTFELHLKGTNYTERIDIFETFI